MYVLTEPFSKVSALSIRGLRRKTIASIALKQTVCSNYHKYLGKMFRILVGSSKIDANAFRMNVLVY